MSSETSEQWVKSASKHNVVQNNWLHLLWVRTASTHQGEPKSLHGWWRGFLNPSTELAQEEAKLALSVYAVRLQGIHLHPKTHSSQNTSVPQTLSWGGRAKEMKTGRMMLSPQASCTAAAAPMPGIPPERHQDMALCCLLLTVPQAWRIISLSSSMLPCGEGAGKQRGCCKSKLEIFLLVSPPAGSKP